MPYPRDGVGDRAGDKAGDCDCKQGFMRLGWEAQVRPGRSWRLVIMLWEVWGVNIKGAVLKQRGLSLAVKFGLVLLPASCRNWQSESL